MGHRIARTNSEQLPRVCIQRKGATPAHSAQPRPCGWEAAWHRSLHGLRGGRARLSHGDEGEVAGTSAV